MADRKLIVIAGATGTQGRSAVEALLVDSKWRARAITRKKSGLKAQVLQSRGAEVVEANLNDGVSPERVFQGVQTVFAVTDFSTICVNQSPREHLEPGQSFLKNCYEVEVQQSQNIFDAAAKVPTLGRLIYSSLPSNSRRSQGKDTKAYHRNAKVLGREYGEQQYPELWSKTSVINMVVYLTNSMLRPTKNNNTGTCTINSASRDQQFSMVAADEDTGTLARALLAAELGKKLVACRGWMSMDECANAWSQSLGVKVVVVIGENEQVPAEIAERIADALGVAQDFEFFV